MKKNKNKERSVVKESSKSKKVRDKLIRHWAQIDQQVTEENLQEKTDEIHQWIARHASDRVAFKAKNFSLFDGNQNAAKLSKKVAELSEKLQKELKDSLLIDKS